ncbi:septum formation initiator family protein [uncultured Eubacterium sp.]|uniref:FtsB family cell division protein n=1 Tax=uncultured Eubacterium sp. TaxID=165185 RepID=UPI002804A3D4|nr:septum formation initiator family protein [uncultured Eubacterium sp.]
MKVKAEKTANKKTITMIVLGILALALLIYCSYCIADNAADISRLRTQKQELESQYEQQIEDNSQLKSILDSDDKKDYLEQKARENNYVNENEIDFYDVN